MHIVDGKLFLNLKIAIGSLCIYRLRSILAVAGVFLGTLSLVVVANVSESLTLKTQRETEKLGKNLLIVRSGLVKRFGRRARLFSEATTLTRHDALMLKTQINGVEDVVPTANRVFPVRYKDRKLDKVLVVGASADFPDMRNFHPSQGRFFNERDDRELSRVVVLGSSVAERLFGEENPLGKDIYIYRALCRVVGVMEPKGVDVSGIDQDDQIIMPLNTYLRRFVNKTHINMIYVKVSHESLLSELKGRITDLLRREHSIVHEDEDDFTVIDIRDVAALKTEALSIVKTLGRIAGAVAFIIGGIGILSIMILSVNERKIEIGIRRAVGSRKKDIINQFLFEASFISLSGGIAGMFSGMIISFIFFVFSDFPLRISIVNMAIAFSASVFIGILAGLYPSVKATTFQPVEVLKE
jgi:putative ABC transport system permease protein